MYHSAEWKFMCLFSLHTFFCTSLLLEVSTCKKDVMCWWALFTHDQLFLYSAMFIIGQSGVHFTAVPFVLFLRYNARMIYLLTGYKLWLKLMHRQSIWLEKWVLTCTHPIVHHIESERSMEGGDTGGRDTDTALHYVCPSFSVLAFCAVLVLWWIAN